MSQDNQRGSGEILEPIPTDLINEIFSRLPAKSAVRFRCLSKLWGSMLHRPYFNELFLTNSLARPRLLLAVIEQSNKCSFFSLSQLQSPCEKSSSLVVAADFHIKFPPGEMTILYSSDLKYFSFGYASGLIYFSDMWPTKNDYKPVICNPITGQYATLPKLWRYRKSFSFLGFDPIDKQVKVLFVAYPGCSDDNRILTFRTGKMRWRRSWRKIECPSRHEPLSNGICINGVVYYLAEDFPAFVIVCFDVRSEKFMFVNFNGFEHFGGTECNFSEENCPCGPCSCGKTVINYKGKLCVICWKTIGAEAMEFRMWVLEDIGRQDLSEYVYTLPVSEFGHEDVSVVGMTARGEIVFHNNRYVFYFNPERNTLQTVEIQGLVNGGTVLAFMDHVEDLNVIDGKLLKSSIFAPSVKNKAT